MSSAGTLAGPGASRLATVSGRPSASAGGSDRRDRRALMRPLLAGPEPRPAPGPALRGSR